MKKDTIWHIILIASIILIIHSYMNVSSPDKKTANAAGGEGVLGLAGLTAVAFKKGFYSPFLTIAGSPVIWIGVGLVLMLTTGFLSFKFISDNFLIIMGGLVLIVFFKSMAQRG